MPQDNLPSNKQGPIPEKQKEIIKQRFLEVMAKTNIIATSCEQAGITRMTYLAWKREGFISEAELEAAYEEYQDAIRGEIIKRGFVGQRKPLLSSGRLVKDDDNKPIYIDVPDNNLLLAIARNHLPEWKQEQRVIVEQTVSGIPPQYELVFDYRLLTDEERVTLHQIASAVHERQSKDVIDSTVVVEALEITGNGHNHD